MPDRLQDVRALRGRPSVCGAYVIDGQREFVAADAVGGGDCAWKNEGDVAAVELGPAFRLAGGFKTQPKDAGVGDFFSGEIVKELVPRRVHCAERLADIGIGGRGRTIDEGAFEHGGVRAIVAAGA